MSDQIKQPDAEGYVTAVPISAIKPDEITQIDLNGVNLILTQWQGKIWAFNGRCPHASADLGEGHLGRGRISCPDHDYKFDIRTGRTLWPEDEACRLKKYPVKVENSVVKVRLT